MPEQPKTDACEHKWVFLRSEGTEECGYRRWRTVDVFFCEKCLEQRVVRNDLVEKVQSRW